MARRRKAEVKTLGKPQPKAPATRKSNRQRTKKQLEEEKVNGNIASTNATDSSNDDNSQKEPIVKENTVPKKSARHKTLVEKDKSVTRSGSGQSGNNSDQSDDEIEKIESVEKQISIGENTLNDVVWSGDVIEETIICEEMEVDAEVTDSCSLGQSENVVLEQVLLVNNSNFEEKDIVEYTVIQTEEDIQSVVVSSDNIESIATINDDFKSSNSCNVIEQGLSVLHVSEVQESNDSETMESFENQSKSVSILDENKVDSDSTCSSDNSKNTFSNKECSRLLRSASRSGRGIKNRKSIEQSTFDNSSKKKSEVSNKKSSAEGKEKLNKTKKSDSTVPMNVEASNTQSSSLLLQNLNLSAKESDSSSYLPDRTESQCLVDTSASKLLIDNKVVNSSLILDQKSVSSTVDIKTNVSNNPLIAAKHILFGSEEHSRDSELDEKVDSEDNKLLSSSENSSDTLPSNNLKNTDINLENKNLLNQLNETDKKLGFRSRSGSTDTTESESGSNNSGVRRSSRIRTIGLMKPRSRGRGLVSKSVVDSIKTTTITTTMTTTMMSTTPTQQEQDKFSTGTTSNEEHREDRVKENCDNAPETQSDKENNSNKTVVSQDILTPLISANGTTGYDSDSNKPVKVKSRWRRSSELEMSNTESFLISRTNSSFSNSSVTGMLTGIVPNSVNDTTIKLPSMPVGLPEQSKMMEIQEFVMASSQNNTAVDNIHNTTIVSNNSLVNETISTTLIPKAVGAKISLPMIPAVEDREMEERLSQFEHLKENLYLTERYTSKETKRMLCDCFLTEEEFQRGELGCGEDCLNRLLMIECGPRCIVGDRCTNKRFQNCEYADCEVFRTEKKGFGLRARSNMNVGEFIMEYVGEVVNPKDFRKRAKEYSKDKNRHYYFMALKSDQIIDATMKGNISRFINHSCDPNAETQKWTVNGELRIGFFNKKFIAAGEEITFDYHFQRYGKEAQKCFCEATNCRGWIGDNPEDNKEKPEYTDDVEDEEDDTEDDIEDDKEDKDDKEDYKEKKCRRQIRRKKAEKKVSDHMEDEDLEEQIDKLCATGLKNRTHTLALSRLMVRSREIQHRTRLLKVIQSGEQPCRRLFLDYHGLRLMWSYMMDVAGNMTDDVQQFRLEILKTLSTLPIPNKTMLIDSKVLSVIEKWSKQLYHSPSSDSPEDDQSKLKSNNEELDVNNSETSNEQNDVKKLLESDIKNEMKEEIDPNLITELAANLLVEWSNLKEVFRIPKKERIEQMKEHEREADRGYKEDIEKEAKENSIHERYKSDRYNRTEPDKRLDRRRGRDSPDFENIRTSKEKRVIEERPNLIVVPRMSKFERRQLFALKVAKEEEERQRRQQEDLWQQHEAHCLALGLDPYATAAFDPQTGYPLFFNPQLGQWQAYPVHIPEGAGPVYVSAAAATGEQPQSQPQLVYPGAYGPALQLQNGAAAAAVAAGVPVAPVAAAAAAATAVAAIAAAPTALPPASQPETEPPELPPPPLDLPPKWKWARDKRGRLYYYHAKERISQWLPPPPDHIAVQPDSSTTSESSEDESSSSNEEEEEDDESSEPQHPPQQTEQLFAAEQPMDVDKLESEPIYTAVPETKKRRDGLVQERIISPRREEDRVDHKKYKEIKEKLRRQKERAKLKENLEKMKKHKRSSKSKSYSKHNTSKFQSITSDMSPTTERKIKDTFRINMAEVMVHFLNPYRKNDCKQGRITNTEDFKHLARKLTHFVLAKELKHCKSVDELECNDNVKHKAKDFVRKYMSKFGAVYQKSTDDD